MPHEWTAALGSSALSSARTLAARLAQLAQRMMAERIRRAGAVPGLLPDDERPPG